MRVGIDVQIADVSSAGIGQATRAIAAELPRVDPETDYLNLRPVGRRSDFSMPERWWWDQVALPRLARRQRADVLLKTGFSVPVRSSVPTVVFLHDLAARRFPSHLNRPSAWFYGRWLPWTLKYSQKILTLSNFTVDEAVELLGLPREKFVVVGGGVSRPTDRVSADSVHRKFQLPAQFLLHVGTIEPRKNLAFLIRAFAQFHAQRPAISLVLAGGRSWRSADVQAEINRLNLLSSVHLIGGVSDDEKWALYRSAVGLVFPTRYEGFGLPPLEALAVGTPVLAADVPAIREIVGDAGMLVSGYDEGVWASRLKEVVENHDLRRRLVETGQRRVQEFSWERSAVAIARVLHHTIHD